MWAKHAAVSAPDTTCATCHAPEVANVLPGHFGQTVQTAGQQMIAGDTIGCVSCHDLDGTTTGSHDQSGWMLGDGDNVVWGPVIPVRGSVTCDTCHVNRATQHTTAVAHDNRAIDSTCGACHTSDPTILGSPGTGTLASAADVDTLHGTCATCHNYTGTRVDPRDVRDAIAQGVSGTPVSCTDCHINQATGHGNRSHTVQVGANDLSYDAPGQLCSVCHLDQSGTLVSDWTVIEAEHNVVNGAGSCATCHNSSRQAVIDTIAAGANPTNCLACHADKELTVHGNPDHVARGFVTGGTTTCLNCHDPGTAANATVTTIHNDNCALCHTSVPTLQTGLPAGGGDCLACHTSTWETLHSVNTPVHTNLVQVATTSCASCHTDPPPLTDAADMTNHNACASCHDANGGLIGSAVGKDFITGGNCISCHGILENVHGNFNHVADPGTGPVAIFADYTHDDAAWAYGQEAPHFDIMVTCTICHNTDLPKVHGNDCATCHPTPYNTLGVWEQGCQQASCHPSIHEDIAPSHDPYEDAYNSSGNDCSVCHIQNWSVPQTNCLNCHAATTAGDLTPPTTTANVQTEYIGAAKIDFSIQDNGKLVGMGRTFYQLNGGNIVAAGKNLLITSPADYQLQFWSIDQAGNTETTVNTENFTILEDTTAPVTTSNAQPTYTSGTTITLNSTDDSTLGVKNTYYGLNGGAVNTGTRVAIPGTVGISNYTLTYWSEDWSGNVETQNSVSFTVDVPANGTIRLIWWDADEFPEHSPGTGEWMSWTIKRGTTVVSTGFKSGPWSGVDDITVPVSETAYTVSLSYEWWGDAELEEGSSIFNNQYMTTAGQVIELHY